ncbi:ectoine synthase [Burkholderia sp. BCC0322]|uniref:ectoine synthase n=1 Tax=unclassified Burkholderia TaxID=2613784 RepID=UPI001FC8402E|nr:ectoine synthase [Burkholderia sp. BCC0322]
MIRTSCARRATRGDLHLVCVINPPLTGLDTHRSNGSYAPPAGRASLTTFDAGFVRAALRGATGRAPPAACGQRRRQ